MNNKKLVYAVDVVNALADKLTLADLYSAHAISEVSVAIFKKRVSLGLTQKELGEKLGVKQSMISKWENGDYNFTLETIAEICAKMDMVINLRIEDYADIKTEWTMDIGKVTGKESKKAVYESEKTIQLSTAA
ncbi:MAG: helix-turn-helix domain-containing protein [Clostridiales bacterium]|jgi:transcriptional regulator with XRE-family HTH domain|nr:helix-turn-helix domain-containing protein [Clostridiales bacterium]